MADTDVEKRRKALLLLFLLLIDDAFDHLSQSVRAYLIGSANIHVTSARFVAALLGAHTTSAYYGRQAAGVTAPLGQIDHAFAQAVMAGQSQYVTRLVTALADGEYTLTEDKELPGDLRHRLLLYALRLRGTALEAMTLAFPLDTMIERRLGTQVERHCDVCPDLVGFYHAGEMTQWPGDGSTPCLSFCDCRLFVDGAEMFPFPEDLP